VGHKESPSKGLNRFRGKDTANKKLGRPVLRRSEHGVEVKEREMRRAEKVTFKKGVGVPRRGTLAGGNG